MQKIGFIGLGKMGKAMVLNLLEKGVDVVVYNRTQLKIKELSSEMQNAKCKMQNDNSKFKNKKTPQLTTNNLQPVGNLIPSYSIQELIDKLKPPRTIWLMVEHGKPVDEVIEQLLSAGLVENDILIDGGNSFYKDSIRRFEELKKKGIHFLDIGTSGGLEGARNGACMMVGGEEKVFNQVKPILQKISASGGVAYFGPTGAGHFVKMTHNGVEYGMLQAIGEGFEILQKGPYILDLHQVAKNWTKGSIVRGWLMELLERALERNLKFEIYNLKSNPKSKDEKINWLAEYSGSVGGGPTGEWTVQTAEELKVDAPVITGSLEARKKSVKKPSFAGKVISALRFQFGGHK